MVSADGELGEPVIGGIIDQARLFCVAPAGDNTLLIQGARDIIVELDFDPGHFRYLGAIHKPGDG